MDLEELKFVVKSDRFKVTIHALQEKEADNISLIDIEQSLVNSEIIEDYKNDKPFPSCLVLGFGNNSKPIHSVWAYNSDSKQAVLITVYRPNPEKWVEYRKRK